MFKRHSLKAIDMEAVIKFYAELTTNIIAMQFIELLRHEILN